MASFSGQLVGKLAPERLKQSGF